MRKIFLSMSILLGSILAQAQTPYVLTGSSYTQDFDGIGGGLPTGWRVDSLVNKNAGLGNDAQSKFSPATSTWGNTSRGFKNLASADGLLATASTADQNASTDRVLGIRQVSSVGWDDIDSLVSASFQIANTAGLTNFNLQFKIQSLNTGAKRYSNWIVQYGFGASPASFTTITTTPAILTLDSNFTNTSVSVQFGSALDNKNQAVWIRIMPSDTSLGQGNRPHVGIDDFQLTWTGNAVNNAPLAVTLTPSDNAINVPVGVTNLLIDFDKNITLGTGNITIKNLTDVTNQVIAVANVNVSGMSVTIPGVNLVAGKDYAVQYDSTCFQNGGYNSFGIYNNTDWNFSTIPGVTPPQTSLNETFTGCLAPNLGSFTQTSVIGAQVWKCSKFGYGDSSAVYMNGYAGGATNDNEDWLISPELNMSAMADPKLHFWSKKRFSGNNTKEVFISNNYTGDVATANWDNFNIDFSNLDSVYSIFNNINLAPFKATPFRIAFKYVSNAAGTADEWSIDDVSITDGPMGVRSLSLQNTNIKVLGTANEKLSILIETDQTNTFEIEILDMMGVCIFKTNLAIQSGMNRENIDVRNLSHGIYFIQLNNGKEKSVLKFLK